MLHCLCYHCTQCRQEQGEHHCLGSPGTTTIQTEAGSGCRPPDSPPHMPVGDPAVLLKWYYHDSHTDLPTYAPSVPGCPICMAPARCQLRRSLNVGTHPSLATPLAWPQLEPTQETSQTVLLHPQSPSKGGPIPLSS